MVSFGSDYLSTKYFVAVWPLLRHCGAFTDRFPMN